MSIELIGLPHVGFFLRPYMGSFVLFIHERAGVEIRSAPRDSISVRFDLGDETHRYVWLSGQRSLRTM